MNRFRSLLVLGAILALPGCSPEPTAAWHGYVEGEFLYLASPAAGYLDSLPHARGSRVSSGAPVFSISADPDEQSLRAAEARTEAARSQAANLQQPRRDTEVAALEAQVRAAQSALALSETQLKQQRALAGKGFVAQSALDQAIAARRRDAATLDAAREQLQTYRDSVGRSAEIASAEAQTRAAAADAARQAWVVQHSSVSAPADGELSDTYYQPGEWVAAGAPVAALLPDGKRRIRFFVPQAVVSTLAPGTEVTVSCDGCGDPFPATVDFIASETEYTPPVIYSEKMRAQLVFRVEAVPAPAVALKLRPGQPVDVQPVAH